MNQLLLNNEQILSEFVPTIVQLTPRIRGVYFTHCSQFSACQTVPTPFRQKIQYSENNFAAITVATNYRVLIMQKVSDSYFVPVISVPYGLIQNVDKIGGQKSFGDNKYGIRFSLKSPLQFQVMLDKNAGVRKQLFNQIQTLMKPVSSFDTSITSILHSPLVNDQVYNPIEEYARMGVNTNIELPKLQFSVKRLQKLFPNLSQNDRLTPEVIQPNPSNNNVNNNFKLVHQNFGLCESYPQFLAFPDIPAADLHESAKFRSSNRLPVLLWTAQNQPCIARCAQPRQGMSINSNEADVRLVNAFCTPKYPKSIIFDARPLINIQVNQIQGKGVESINNYSSIEKAVYLGLENIHAVRQAFDDLNEALKKHFFVHLNRENGYDMNYCEQKMLTDAEVLELNPKLILTVQFKQFKNICVKEQKRNQSKKPLIVTSEVEYFESVNKYTLHIQQILKGAYLIVQSLRQGRNAIIHCSDGWDRTPQLTSLAQLAIDPYYRTCRGFAILIQKEFLSFGHRFGTRNNLFMYTSDQKEQAPIFFMFLEAVYNVIKQNVEQFEFDQDFLLYLAFQCWNRQTGTFLFDCECDRQVNMAQQLSNSVFDDVDQWKVREAQGGEVNIQVEQTTLWWDWWGQHM
ncbi:Myotubularin-like_protein [Hexamita inflata]|uniref:Myotubularin-like_protein n=1 Tax=Hexamita inflata TaxID=28002 RepID=A0ABP1HTB9_9EUKA